MSSVERYLAVQPVNSRRAGSIRTRRAYQSPRLGLAEYIGEFVRYVADVVGCSRGRDDGHLRYRQPPIDLVGLDLMIAGFDLLPKLAGTHQASAAPSGGGPGLSYPSGPAGHRRDGGATDERGSGRLEATAARKGRQRSTMGLGASQINRTSVRTVQLRDVLTGGRLPLVSCVNRYKD